MTTPALPEGYAARLRPDVRRLDGGRVVVGGSPTTVLKLSPRALALLDTGLVTVRDAASRELATRLLAANLADPVLPVIPADDDPARLARLVTVVIPVRDRADELARALAALDGAVRVVVVDDGSVHPAAVRAAAETGGARLLRHERNTGPAQARNTGLAQVATPYVAFVDSDVRVDAAALAALAAYLVDPGTALVAPRIRGESASGTAWFERYDAECSSLDLGPVAAQVRPGAVVPWVPSACLLARTDALAGGFDPALRLGEDVDLVWRLVDASLRVRYAPEVVVHHDSRTTVRGWLGRKTAYGSSSAALAERHGARVAPAVLTVSQAALTGALLAQRRWSLPLAGALAAYGLVDVRRRLPAVPGRDAEAARLVAAATGWTVRQTGDLMLRHWWPLTLAAAVGSRRARRAAAFLAVTDLLVRRARGEGQTLRPATHLLARRLDDAAYGAGLWLGAWRARSRAALTPRIRSG